MLGLKLIHVSKGATGMAGATKAQIKNIGHYGWFASLITQKKQIS